MQSISIIVGDTINISFQSSLRQRLKPELDSGPWPLASGLWPLDSGLWTASLEKFSQNVPASQM